MKLSKNLRRALLAAAAALLLGETLSGRGWLGAGMVLASLLLASRMQLREGNGKM